MVAVRLEGVLSGHLAGVEPDAAVRTEGPRHTCGVQAGDESDAFVGARPGQAWASVPADPPDRVGRGCTYSVPRFPEPSTEISAVVPASALWSMCRLLAAAARLAALPVTPEPARSSARDSTRPHSSTGASRKATSSCISWVHTSPRSAPKRSWNVWPWDWRGQRAPRCGSAEACSTTRSSVPRHDPTRRGREGLGADIPAWWAISS